MYRTAAPVSSPSRLLCVVSCTAVSVLLCGCVSTAPLEADNYDIAVALDPATHHLAGCATLNVRCPTAARYGKRPVAVEFVLNRALTVDRVSGPGVEIREHAIRPLEASDSDEGAAETPLQIHRLVLDNVPPDFQLTFDYQGALAQDVQAGEQAGEIHNFLMSAHVSKEGIYLEAGGGWYPQPHHDAEQDAPHPLANFRLAADSIPDMQLVASASSDSKASVQTGKKVWHSPYPLDGLVLVGGPHRVKSGRSGNVQLALHYASSTDPEEQRLMDRHTDLFLEAAKQYLQRYEPLVGPYPFEQYTIVENFFSSGFAFPQFTLLSRVLLEMGPKGLKHGYLDHEMLHSWWGNSVYVDESDGNWCEALASYGANYYGYVLDGDQSGARRARRNYCNFLSRIKPEEDKPLATFGRPDGAGRGIGYSKGAMVLHMLARTIGQDAFWAAMRDLTAQYTGRYASWGTLQMLFEQRSGINLDAFFDQWIHGSGAPNLQLSDALWHRDRGVMEVTIDQGDTEFALSVPLRLAYEDGSSQDHVVEIDRTRATVQLACQGTPTAVVLDPDYHVFRKLRPAEVMPTTAITRADKHLQVITPAAQLPPFYRRVISNFGSKDDTRTVVERPVNEVPEEDLSAHSLLILGEAVHDPRIQALLARTRCPIRWHRGGFTIEGRSYDDPAYSVLCTVHHPDVPSGGITVYTGNSEDALGRSDLLLFYSNSLVVFETTAREADGEKAYSSDVVLRRDFETQEEIAVRTGRDYTVVR